MRVMLAQLWAAMTTLFTAFDSIAKAILYVAQWGEVTALEFKEEAEAERAAKANAAKQQLKAVK